MVMPEIFCLRCHKVKVSLTVSFYIQFMLHVADSEYPQSLSNTAGQTHDAGSELLHTSSRLYTLVAVGWRVLGGSLDLSLLK